jgi:hypothetical protein
LRLEELVLRAMVLDMRDYRTKVKND